jgi:hypothetical protein
MNWQTPISERIPSKQEKRERKVNQNLLHLVNYANKVWLVLFHILELRALPISIVLPGLKANVKRARDGERMSGRFEKFMVLFVCKWHWHCEGPIKRNRALLIFAAHQQVRVEDHQLVKCIYRQ